MNEAAEAAIADMKEEYGTLAEDTEVAHTEPVKELYSKSIDFIPNKSHGIKTTIGYINFNIKKNV